MPKHSFHEIEHFPAAAVRNLFVLALEVALLSIALQFRPGSLVAQGTTLGMWLIREDHLVGYESKTPDVRFLVDWPVMRDILRINNEAISGIYESFIRTFLFLVNDVASRMKNFELTGGCQLELPTNLGPRALVN